MTSEAVFIQVGALADGFAPHGNLLATASLPAGENFTFYVAGSEPQQLVIEDEQTLSWNGKRAPWRATALRPDILFIDFLDPERDNASISAVCNLTQRNATLVYGQLPDEAAARLDAFSRVEQGLPLTAVEARFVFARLDAQPGPLPGFTTALVGMRNQYTYSPTERYEHIYLNDNFYAWQCLDGVEKGLADVDRCHYVQVAEDLYLFVWREKIIPTLGVILIDLQQMRTDGKIMGYQGSDFAPSAISRSAPARRSSTSPAIRNSRAPPGTLSGTAPVISPGGGWRLTRPTGASHRLTPRRPGKRSATGRCHQARSRFIAGWRLAPYPAYRSLSQDHTS